MTAKFTLFSGTANPNLAGAIASELGVRPGYCAIERFPDGEVCVQLNESVCEQKVFIVQPTCPPVDLNLMELLAFADACRRSDAASVTAIVPYFGYSRADKRHGQGQPIMGSVVATMMQTAGIDRLIAVDLHAPQLEGFFQIPVDSLTATPTLAEALSERLPKETIVVSPDTGRIPMAIEYARRFDTRVAVLHKQRQSGTKTDVTHVVGDVKGKTCLIIDDMISTGGTIAKSIKALLAAGANPQINVAATHGLFVNGAAKKLDYEGLQEILVSDTVPISFHDSLDIRVVSIAPIIAAAIGQMVVSSSVLCL